MSTTEERIVQALRASTKEVERLRKQNQRLLATTREPIAITGMSCRLPGGIESPAQLWEALSQGRTGLSPFPSDRGWNLEHLHGPDPAHNGTCYVREAGFLDKPGDFDAEFFKLPPSEALLMDPQQRLLLEVGWEAIESAGIDPTSLRGSETGVFAGVMSQEYLADPAAAGEEVASIAMGNAPSVVTGRVAYALGLEGPAVTVDTACSSSLVSMHLACSALRAGECSMALAGGVSVFAWPDLFVTFSVGGVLSPDGRCRSFADGAEGTNWGEGVGVLLLERLSDAQRLGHPVLAVIRGSAINQDGASNGFSAPSGPSQRRVIERALASAGLSAQDIDAVEAHGTGTMVGDPIEAQALLSTYGKRRREGEVLWLGSIKSNFGHVLAAAGVAGVIKMVLALDHETLPRTLHVDRPSRRVDWSEGAVSLLREPVNWPRGEIPRRAGVSSFGITGTNAHVIVEEAPRGEPAPPSAGGGEREEAAQAEALLAFDGVVVDGREHGDGREVLAPPVPWILSGVGRQALCAQAGRLVDHLSDAASVEPLDVGLSLASSRAALEDRAVLLGAQSAELLDRLRCLARGETAPGLLQGRTHSNGSRLAFMFAGEAPQPRPGGELYRVSPAFRAAFDEVAGGFGPTLGEALQRAAAGPDDEAPAVLDSTLFAGAWLFASEVALFRLLEIVGLEPDYIVAGAIGELAALHVAEALRLEHACALVCAYGAQMPALLAKVELREPQIPILSSLTGQTLTRESASEPGHWADPEQSCARFGDAVSWIATRRVASFIELGSSGALSLACRELLAQRSGAQGELSVVPLLGGAGGDAQSLLEALASAWVIGAPVQWPRLFAGSRAMRAALPTYAFQRKRYWLNNPFGAWRHVHGKHAAALDGEPAPAEAKTR